MTSLNKETLEAVRNELGSIINDTIPAGGSGVSTEVCLSVANERLDRLKTWLDQQIDPEYKPRVVGCHSNGTPAEISTYLDNMHDMYFSDCLKVMVVKDPKDEKFFASITGLRLEQNDDFSYNTIKGDSPSKAIENLLLDMSSRSARIQVPSHYFPPIDSELLLKWFPHLEERINKIKEEEAK